MPNRAGATTGRQEGACGAYEVSSPVRFRIWRPARPSVVAAALAVSGVVPWSPTHFRGGNANRERRLGASRATSQGGGATYTSRRPLRPPGGAAGLRLRGRGLGWVRRVVARAPGPGPSPGQGRRVRPSFCHKQRKIERIRDFAPPPPTRSAFCCIKRLSREPARSAAGRSGGAGRRGQLGRRISRSGGCGRELAGSRRGERPPEPQ